MRALQPLQEHLHGTHHVRMGIEGATRKTYVGRAFRAEPFHQIGPPADHANRQATAQRFAVGDHIGAHSEVFLRAAGSQAKAHEDLVEDQHDAAFAAHLAQLLQPPGSGRAVKACAAAAVHQRRVARSRRVGMQGLQRVHQHTGNIPTRPQHAQRTFMHVTQSVGGVCRHWVSGTGLHLVPPAMVGTTKADDVAAPGVVARKAHRLHHCFGARHVERHLIQAGNLAQPLQVVQHAGVVSPENRAQALDSLGTFFDTRFVEVVAKQVDAVGARQIKQAVAVNIVHHHTFGGLQECAHSEVFSKVAAVGKGYSVSSRELQVGQGGARFNCHRHGFREALRKCFGQLLEARFAAFHHFSSGTVRSEKCLLFVLVAGDPCRQPFGPAHVTRQRGVFGQRQSQPLPGFRQYQRCCSCHCGGHGSEFEIRIDHGGFFIGTCCFYDMNMTPR